MHRECNELALFRPDMKVIFFTLCDYAKNEGGRLTIVDTFDVVKAAKLPWRAYFGFALKILLDHDDADSEKIILSINSQDNPNNILFETATELPKDQRQGLLAMAGNVKGLLFESAGAYCFRIYQDNREIYSYTFKVELENTEQHD